MAYISKYSGEEIENAVNDIKNLQQIILDTIYPVGSLYTSFKSTNPMTLIGGTWEQIKDCFLMAAGATYAAGTSGGSENHTHTSAPHTHSTKDHTLTVAEMPKHIHQTSVNYKAVGGSSSVWAYVTNDSSGLTSSTNLYGFANSVGGSQPHNHGDTNSTTPSDTGSSSNIPPYQTIYMWKRIA